MSSAGRWRRRALPIVAGTLVVTACAVMPAAPPAAAAVESPLTLGYDQQIYGDFLQAGNAVVGCPAAPAGQAADCKTAAGVFNSSSAEVTIPAGAAVDHAELLWAGNTGVYKGSTTLRCATNPTAATAPTGSPATTPVRLTVGADAAVPIKADRLTTDTLADITGAQYYSAAADVTAAFGHATTGSPLRVDVANVWTPQGHDCFGGWSIIVVYKYPTANANAPNQRRVFLYDGHVRQAGADPATSTTITGFTANGRAKVGVVAYGGDRGSGGDRLRINNTAQTGFPVGTKTFDVATTVIKKGDTSAKLTFSATGDGYLAEGLVMSVPVRSPVPVPARAGTKTVGPTTGHRGEARSARGRVADRAAVTAAPPSALGLVTQADPTSVSAVGDTVGYTFTVTNTGTTTLTDVSVDDTLTAPAGPALDPITCLATSLQPGTGTSCTATYAATQDDLDHGTIDNVATASATDPAGDPVTSDPSTTTVDVDQNPGLSLVKSAAPTTVDTVGQQVTYTFRVTNTGNVTVTGVGVTDRLAAPARPQITPVCPDTTLAPGAGTDCTATYTSTAADFNHGRIDNSAVASGTGPAGARVTSTRSTASVTTTQTGALGLVKKAAVTDLNGNGYADLDDTIQWTFAVTNTGTVTLTRIAIDDPLAGAVTCPAGALAAGDTVTCDADTAHVITQADVDAGHMDNTATAHGRSPHTGGDTVTSDPSSTTTPIGAQPGLGLAETGAVVDNNDDDTVDAGDTVVWKFLVTNTGNVTMSTLTVHDTGAGHVTCAVTALAPKLSTTCQAHDPHRLTVADVDGGSVTNRAMAIGAPPSGPTVGSPPSTATVPLPADPGLRIVQTASVTDTDGNGVNDAGDRVVWSLVVTNAGNVTLTAVRVADPKAGTVACPRTTLAPGARMTCISTAHTIRATEAVSGAVSNTATATGRPPSGDAVTSPPSTATVTINAPAGVGGANGGVAGDNSGANLAYTGAKDLPLLIWFGGWSLLAGFLVVLGTVRRRTSGRTPADHRRRTAPGGRRHRKDWLVMRRVALLLVAGLTVLAGCTSSSGGGTHATKAAPSASASASAATASSGSSSTQVTQPKSVPASVPNRTGVISGRLVALTSCRAVTGGWQAQGTAKGGSSKNARYTITVFFTTDRATVQAFGQTKVTVAKGKSAKWTVTEMFKAVPKTVCVLRGAG